MSSRRRASFSLLPRFCGFLLLGGGDCVFVDALALPGATQMPPNRCSDLQKWMEDRSAAFGAIEVRRLSDSERMVIATKDTPKGKILMRIPMGLQVTPSRAVEECGAAEDAIMAADSIGTKDSDLLAIFILTRSANRNEEGNVGDIYTSSLPTREELSHLPMNWNEADAQWLRKTSVGDERISRRRREADFFRNLSERSESFREIAGDLDSWMWAKSNVMSRGFSVPNPLFDAAPLGTCLGEQDEADDVHRDDNDILSPKVAAMVPLADMLNHRTHQEGCSCEFGVERGSGDFLIRTVTPVTAGSEVTVSYGSLSASVSLLNYGFVQEAISEGPQQQRSDDDDLVFHGTTESDFVSVMLSLDNIKHHNKLGENRTESEEASSPSDVDLGAAKKSVWLRDEGFDPDFIGLPMERCVSLGIGTVEPTISVMSLLRVGVATMSELTEILDNCEDDGEENGASSAAAAIARDPVCWRNERAALRAFEGIVRAQADSFKYPAGTSTGNANEQSACKIMDREKSILKHWGLIARIAGQALDERRGSFDFGLSYAKLFRTLLATDERLSSNSKEV